MKTCPPSWSLRKCKREPQRYHFIPVRIALFKKKTWKIASVDENVEKQTPLYIASENVKGKQFGVLKKVTHNYHTTQLFHSQIYIQVKRKLACTRRLVRVCDITTRNSPPRRSMCYMYTPPTRANLENMLRERSQTNKGHVLYDPFHMEWWEQAIYKERRSRVPGNSGKGE